MRIIVGAEFDSWRRQVRHHHLDADQSLHYVLGKSAAFAKEFGFSPMGIDLSIAALPSTDRAYLDELKARLAEHNLIATMYGRTVVLSHDEGEREAKLKDYYKDLETLAYLGVTTAEFDCAVNGFLTRQGHIRLAGDMLGKLGHVAKDLGMRICQENFAYFTSDDLVRICENTGLDTVGINNDVGNWLITGEDPLHATKKCLPYTFHAHVRDYVLDTDYYNGVPLGRGVVDLPSVLSELVKAGVVDPLILTVEIDAYSRDADAALYDSYTYLKEWLLKRGLLSEHSYTDAEPCADI